MEKKRSNGLWVRLAGGIGAALVVAAIISTLALSRTVAVQGSVLKQQTDRARTAEAERKELRECVSDIKGDVREIKVMLETMKERRSEP